MPNVVFTNDRMLAWDDAALRVALDGNCNSGLSDHRVQNNRQNVARTHGRLDNFHFSAFLPSDFCRFRALAIHINRPVSDS